MDRGRLLTNDSLAVTGDQQIVRPPPLDSMQYANLAVGIDSTACRLRTTPLTWHWCCVQASRFGQSGMTKIQRTDTLAAQLEKTGRFMDAVHTYEQSTKMLVRMELASLLLW